MKKVIGRYSKEMIDIFRDTMKAMQPYIPQTISSIKDGILYMENDDRYEKINERSFNTKTKVVKGTTVGEALKVKKKNPDDKVCLLNFASAKYPGGGVVNGSKAQEECVCRCSNLYSVLSDSKFKRRFYDYHKYAHNNLYTSKLIYTPNIVFLRNDDKDYKFLKEPVIMDVITCAAPNIRGEKGKINYDLVRNNNMDDIYYDRVKHIFMAAYTNKVDHLILGAFGCGVFRNSPNDIARSFHEVQDEFHGCFKSVVYAIYCGNDKSSANYDVFNTEFK